MIPVAPQPEPADFDEKVRRKGHAWLAGRGLALTGPAPTGVSLPTHWRACIGDLHQAYRGICAYVCVFIEPVTGSTTVEHFIAKSDQVEHAYEWKNYRLACGKMNGRKSDYSDVLDPFELEPQTFHLNLASGEIFPNPKLPPGATEKAADTIRRLHLDDGECRKMRMDWLNECLTGGITPEYFARKCPFVHQEVERQGLAYP